jgi:beta-N-acetylhexosaminidase
MAIAATGQPELAEKISAATGKEMRLAGINWCFSPVADINSNPLNPVIGVRSFSDNPETVSTFSQRVASGLYASKVAPCAKHFPGHGDTDIDSHLALPIIHKDLAALQATELIPFIALIGFPSRAMSIMTAHIALPSFIGDNTPASLSAKITTELLRGQLGFKGVVTTDCLEMDAVAAIYGTERAAVLALQAGADIAMICHTYERQLGAIKATYEAFEAGSIPLAQLVESAARIRELKDAVTGSWEDVTGYTMKEDYVSALLEGNAKLSSSAYSASTCWLNPQRPFRIDRSEVAVLFFPRLERINPAVDDSTAIKQAGNAAHKEVTLEGYNTFLAEVSARVQKCEHFVYSPEESESQSLRDDVLHALSASDKVVFITRNADRAAWQLTYLRKVISVVDPNATGRIVVVSSCGPYDLSCEASRGIDLPCVCAFEFTNPAMASAAKVIFGELEANGNVPVKI